jgi:hypothetical protein
MTAQMAVLPFEAPKKKPSFGAMLGATKTKEAAPKKVKMPTLEPTPEIKTAVDEYVSAKAIAKQAEAVMDVNGAQITEYVRERQDADGYARKFSGSYQVMGHQSAAKVIFANKYSLSADDEAQLAEILGENFETMITAKHTVKLKDEVFEDEGKQARLMELLGDEFADFFETKTALGVCEEFNRQVYQVLRPEELENLRVYAKQYKPSIR